MEQRKKVKVGLSLKRTRVLIDQSVSESQTEGLSSEGNSSYKPPPFYLQRLEQIQAQGIPPFPVSQLVVQTDEQSDEEQADHTSSHMTPLPPPDLSYHCWKPLTMVSYDPNVATLPEASELRHVEVADTGGIVGQTTDNEDTPADDRYDLDDDFNYSFEDDLAITALLENKVPPETHHTSYHPTDTGLSSNKPTHSDPHTSIGSGQIEEDVLITSEEPPVDVYEIDDDLNMSTEDFNRIDADVDLYIQQSPVSSSSDELPSVDWTGHSKNVLDSNAHSRRKSQWQPVVDNYTASHSDARKQGEHHCSSNDTQLAHQSRVQARSASSTGTSTGNNNCLALSSCPMCSLEFPSGFTQIQADEHYALCLSIEDLGD